MHWISSIPLIPIFLVLIVYALVPLLWKDDKPMSRVERAVGHMVKWRDNLPWVRNAYDRYRLFSILSN